METMEELEPPMTTVQYPNMRAEVVGALKALSDHEYQQRVWTRHDYPHDKFYDDLTTNLNILFDDTCVLPDPKQRIGWILYPNEVEALRELAEVLDPLITELGDADDTHYLEHSQWGEVVRRAGNAQSVFNQNDGE